MPSEFAHVKPGDPLPTSASFINATIETIDQVRSGRTATPSDIPLKFGQMFIKNTSGTDRKRFEILAYTTPVFSRETDAEEIGQLVMTGITPQLPDHVGRFVVLQQPIANGKTGVAMYDGLTPAWVEIEDEDQKWADVTDNDGSKLTSRDTGGARIICPCATGTGKRLSWVHVGVATPRVQKATLEEDLVGTGTATATLADESREIEVECHLLEGGTLTDGTLIDVIPQPHKAEWLVIAVSRCKE